MRTQLFLFVFALVFCNSDIVEYTVPVFIHGEGGYPCIRIPSIITVKSGKLLACAECRKFTGDGCNPVKNSNDKAPNAYDAHICMKTSTDFGKTWSNLTFPFGTDAKMDDPEPVYDSISNTIVFPVKKEINGHDTIVQKISYDEGESWVEETDLIDTVKPYQSALPGPGAGLMKEFEPHKGRLLWIAHYGAYNKDIVWYSDDHGKTHKRADYLFPQMDEAMLVELNNGTVMANLRTNHKWGPYRGQSISKDGGETWSESRPDKNLIEPVCQASIIRSGKTLYFSNPDTTNSRVNMTIKMSNDDGESWQKYVLLTTDESAYSCLTRVNQADHIGIIYEKNWEKCNGHACAILYAHIKTGVVSKH